MMEVISWLYTENILEVLVKARAETLPQHQTTHHAIDLEPVYKSPYGLIYHVSEFELKMLMAYIKPKLANRFTQ